jgi:hypothetical protein
MIILQEHEKLKFDHDIISSRFDVICLVRDNTMHELEETRDKLVNLQFCYDALSSIVDDNKNAMLECEIARNELASFKENHVCSSSNNDALFRNEFKNINDRMNSLNSTLNDCVHMHKKLENVCVKKQSSLIKKTTHHAHMYAKVHKCTICGRKGHVAKFCFDRVHKPVSIGTNVSKASHMHSMPHTHLHAPIEHHKHAIVYDCTLCGRKGHLAKYCFDAKKSFVEKKNSLKSPHVYVLKKNLSAPYHTLTTSTHPFHCSYCGRNGHLKEFCFDRSKAINAPKWVHNPKAFDFTSRGNVPNSFGPKRFWAPKTF